MRSIRLIVVFGVVSQGDAAGDLAHDVPYSIVDRASGALQSPNSRDLDDAVFAKNWQRGATSILAHDQAQHSPSIPDLDGTVAGKKKRELDEEFKNKVEDAEESIANATRKVESANAEWRRAEKAVAAAKDEEDQATVENITAKKEVAEANNEIKQANKSIAWASDEMKQARAAKSLAEQSMVQARAENITAKKEIAKADHEIRQANKSMAWASDVMKQARAAKSQAEQSIVQARAENSTAKKEIAEADNEIRQANKSIVWASDEMKQAHAAKSQAAQSRVEARTEMKTAKKMIEREASYFLWAHNAEKNIATLKALLLAWNGGGQHPWNWSKIACDSWWPETADLYASEVDCSLWPMGRAFRANVEPVYSLHNMSSKDCHLRDLAGANLVWYKAELLEVDIVAETTGKVLFPLIRETYESQHGCFPGSNRSTSSTLLRGYYTFNDAHKIVSYESEYWEASQGTLITNFASKEKHIAWPSFVMGSVVGTLPLFAYWIKQHRHPPSTFGERLL